MPSVSVAQRRVAAMAKRLKEGTLHLADIPAGARDDVKSMMSMSLSQLTDFASTKEKNLPKHAKKSKKGKKRA